jgi:hypothetical protein
MKMPSIFGIGLSKTGTTSLTEALKILGYVSRHWPCSMSSFKHCDALTDITVSCRYKQLDQMFPASKFIYTIRESSSWLESCKAHWIKLDKKRAESKIPPFAEKAEIAMYGTLQFDELSFTNAYNKHHRSVTEYFRTRPGDLLVLNIVAGEGWEKLCPFLGKPVPLVKFPRSNVRHEFHPQ